ncbi:MAG: peptidylprolyl isomerase [Parvularculaceae bacterium]
MLNQVRNSLRSVVAYIFVAALVVSFALWGVTGFFSGSAGDGVAFVGKSKITTQEFRSLFDAQLRQVQLQRADGFSLDMARAQGMDRQILNQMIASRALEEQAEELGFEASDEMVASVIRSQPAFVSPATGRFDQTTYESVLIQNGYTPSAYEAQVRKDLTRTLLIDLAERGFAAPDALINALFRRQEERREVAYVPIQPVDVGAVPAPTEEELAAFREANADRFMTPEYRRLILFTLDPGDFADEVEVDDADLREVYDFRIDDYQTPETRTLRILTFDREDEAAAAAARLRSGEPFEILARERGLTLEATTQEDVRPDDMVDAGVGEAAFEGEVGGVVGPIAGAFGYSVVEIVSSTPAEVRAFEDVVDELREIRAEELAADLIYDLAGQYEEARDDGASIEEAAQRIGREARIIESVNASGFNRDGAVVQGVPPEILREAFEMDLGQSTDQLLEYGDYGFFALTVDEIMPEDLPPLDEIRDLVTAAWRADKLRQMLDARADEFMAVLEAGENFEAAAQAELGRAPVLATVSRRQGGETFSPELLDRIFSARVGDIERGRARLGDSVIIARVVAIQIPPAPPEEVMIGARAVIDTTMSNEILDAFISDLLDEMNARVNERAFALAFPEAL